MLIRYSFLIGIIFFSFSGVSQDVFKWGHYVNSQGLTVEGWINDKDWKNNPKEIEFKESETAEIEVISRDQISYFAFKEGTRYVKAEIQVDFSSESEGKYSEQRGPEFVQDTALLMILIDGPKQLLRYRDNGVLRFYFNSDSIKYEPLIYKKYQYKSFVRENTYYKQQLFLYAPQSDVDDYELQKVNYDQKSLMRYLKGYYNMKNEPIKYEYESRTEDIFKVNLRLGANYSTMRVRNLDIPGSEVTLDYDISARIGVEFEYILPFNNGRWTLIGEPNYSMYSGTGSNDVHYYSAKFQSIELPFGVRWYAINMKKGMVFANVMYAFDISFNSGVTWNEAVELDVNSRGAFQFGAGYKLNRFSAEFRTGFPKDALGSSTFWRGDLFTASFILGYTIKN